MSHYTALIIDDEPDLCELLKLSLEKLGVACDIATDVASAKEKLKKHRFSLCLTDFRLPDGDGLEIIDYALSLDNDLPIAMISAHGNINTAITALKHGAFDFLTKPIEIEQLNSLVRSALALNADTSKGKDQSTSTKMIGESAVTTALRKTLKKIARGKAPIFISGESGSGKEIAAKIIHECSPRRHHPFIAVNCGAIPSELVESEFFGHKKGSFSGAISDKKGLFEAANGGTLLLDEIADLPLPMQVKLLRAIQERSIRPVGSNEEIPVDVRLLSATHKDLQKLMQQNLFRNDLYYRINVIGIEIPPLRQRKEDIPAIAEYIISRMNATSSTTCSLTKDAISRLCTHSFPGNIRELENTLERSFALCESSTLDENDILFQSSPCSNHQDANDKTFHSNKYDNNAIDDDGSKENIDTRANTPLDEYLATIEVREIEHALLQSRWSKTGAAKLLGISFRSLRYRMQKLGFNDE